MGTKLCVYIALLVVLGTAEGRNVNSMDMEEGKAEKDQNENVLFFESSENRMQIESVTCKDGSKCPDGNTCCKDVQGESACCPLPEAVCCEDHVHCCPKDYTCDISQGKCNKGSSSVAMSKKIPVSFMASGESTAMFQNIKRIPCPGGQVSCSEQQTCCEMVSGDYGCCPMPQAVCCTDGTHCCPTGYKCDISAGTCNKGSDVIAWFPKQLADPTDPTSPGLSCPDNHNCLDGETCCSDQQGGYTCCPFSQVNTHKIVLK